MLHALHKFRSVEGVVAVCHEVEGAVGRLAVHVVCLHKLAVVNSAVACSTLSIDSR